MAVIEKILYGSARDHLSPAERDRLLCAFLNAKGDVDVDYKLAAAAFGAASADSFSIMTKKAIKKAQAGASDDSGSPAKDKSSTPSKAKPITPSALSGGDGDSALNVAAVTALPASAENTPKKGAGRKRKSDASEGGGEESKAPTPKKTRKTKKSAVKVEEGEGEAV